MSSIRKARVWMIPAAIAGAVVIVWLVLPIRNAADDLTPRTTEARLDGDSRYRPLVRGDANSWQLLRAAATAQEKSDARALGKAHLLLGDSEKAVDVLSASILSETTTTDVPKAIERSRNAELLNDLAAALYTRGQTRAQPADFVLSLESAERAWRLDRSAVAGWNRALGIEALYLREEAIEAWNEYLAVESEAGWAAEARERVAKLRGVKQVAMEASPETLRTEGEEELLGQWARAAIDGNAAAAAAALKTASRSGAALADSLLRNSVQTIEAADGNARGSLMRGHAMYVEGRELFGEGKMAAAAERLADAESRLRAGGSDFALRACLYGAMAQYHSGRPSVAREQLDRCFAGESAAYPALSADALWARGLVAAAGGMASEALTNYKAALVLFTRTREFGNVAALNNQLAILYMLMGEEREAWVHRRNALEMSSRLELSSQRMRVLLLDVARAASAGGCPLVALRVQSIIAGLAKESEDPFAIANALHLRARYFADAGMLAMASRDVAEAERTLVRITDPAVRTRAATNVRIARAYVTRRGNPAETCRLLQETIDDLHRIQSPLLLPDLYVEMARCQADQNRLDAASQSIDAGLAELAFLNGQVGPFDRRRSHLETHRRVRQAAIEIFARVRQYDRAFAYAERFDDQLRGSSSVPAADAPAARDTAVIRYAVLPEQLLMWVIRDGRMSTFVTPVSSRALQTSVREMNEACSQRDAAACRRTSAVLYRELIDPAGATLPRNLVIVPDDALATIAFAALYDDRAARYLIENHTVLISRCASCAAANDDPRSVHAGAMVAVGNPWPLSHALENLPGAERETRTAARLYADSHLLLGGEATRPNFLNGLRGAEIVHFAGHAIENTELPAQSALLLAKSGDDDGVLTAAEIATVDLSRARVVVLSACGSNAGKVSVGGRISIADAFLRAGAKTVVATLWDADDAGAEPMLVRFHKSLQKGSTAAEALRDAQIAMIQSTDALQSTPANWAAYQVIR